MIILAAVVGVLVLAGLVAGAIYFEAWHRLMNPYLPTPRQQRKDERKQAEERYYNPHPVHSQAMLRFWEKNPQHAPKEVREEMDRRVWAGKPRVEPSQEELDLEARAKAEYEQQERQRREQKAEQERKWREDEARRAAVRKEWVAAARAFGYSPARKAQEAAQEPQVAPQPQVPAPAAPGPLEPLQQAPAATGVTEAQKARVRGKTWQAIRHGDARRNPGVCEWDGCDAKLAKGTRPHHWSYDREDSHLDIAWYCDEHHYGHADRERRREEGSTDEWSDVQVMEAIKMAERLGRGGWQKVGDHYGVSRAVAYYRCYRRFPGHAVFKPHQQKGDKKADKTAKGG